MLRVHQVSRSVPLAAFGESTNPNGGVAARVVDLSCDDGLGGLKNDAPRRSTTHCSSIRPPSHHDYPRTAREAAGECATGNRRRFNAPCSRGSERVSNRETSSTCSKLQRVRLRHRNGTGGRSDRAPHLLIR